MYRKCTKCGKPMTESEAKDSYSACEPGGVLMCDECFKATTLEIARAAFPSAFEDEDAESRRMFNSMGEPQL